jgi:ParB family chromosome partitioning protein
MFKEIPITAITIGERFRKDLGDIAGLAESIADVGLLHPILVTTDLRLLVGRRRLAAYVELGKTTIPAMVIDLDKPLGAEFDENERRKNLNPSERVAICEALYEALTQHSCHQPSSHPSWL